MVIRLSFLVFLLTGCATIERHPVATGVVVAVVAGSIVASTRHDYRSTEPERLRCLCETK